MGTLKKIIQGVICLALLFLLQITFAIQLPHLGDSSQNVLTPLKEAQLGKQFMRVVNAHLPIIDDPLCTDYIQHLGYKLVAQSSRPTQHYYFFIMNNPTINAFSGPDGYIGVDSGLILKTQNESELASVLAHEIGHTAQRHIARTFENQKRIQLSTLGAILAAAIVGTQNPAAGIGAATAATAGSYQQILNFSREYEAEADHIAIQLLYQAHFNPCSMPSFFERIAKQNRLNDLDAPEFLQTHPGIDTRLADAYNRCKLFPSKHNTVQQQYTLIKARIAAIQATYPYPEINTIKTKKDIYSRYLYALLLEKKLNYKKSNQIISELIRSYPSEIMFKLTQADIEHQTKHDKAALRVLSSVYQYNPDYYPVVMQYAQTLLEAHQAHKAVTILENTEEFNEDNGDYLFLLSLAQAQSGNKAAAYRTRAKLSILLGNTKMAKHQMKMAHRH